MRNPELRFKEAMRWERSIEEFIENYITGNVRHPDRILNAPCGKSTIGTHRLDIDSANNPTEIGDINNLPYESNFFDVVIQDPIWKINYYKRMKPFFEAVRVCQLHGIIIYNATWIPESKAVREVSINRIRQSAPFANVSVISIFKKISNQYDDLK